MKNLYIVHAVDTEGPLNESLDATFIRIKELFNIKGIPKNKKTLEDLRNGKYTKNKIKLKKIKETLNPHLLDYKKNWKEIKDNLQESCSKSFRNLQKDSFGNGWVYSWHCVDHVNFKTNPRKKTFGYHKIFDYYKNFIRKKENLKDKIHFHFHPMSTYFESNRNASSFENSPHLHQVMCKRIIDRKWFPVVNRAGFHIERPDSNWFLEQWIPFDLSNISQKKAKNNKIDQAYEARGYDWRRATQKWELYNPSHDDYQVPGKCRRYIGRVLGIMNRTESITLKETIKAFKRASKGKNTMMAVTSHDFRSLKAEVEEVRKYISIAHKRFPKVKIKFCDSLEGFRKVLNIKNPESKRLKLSIRKIKTKNAETCFKISTLKGKVFGPQPYLAMKLKNGTYRHDNLDFGLKAGEWFYSVYEDTIKLSDIKEVAVGAADQKGNFDICSIKFK